MTIDRAEMMSILEEIARNSSNQAARIAAIKQLEEMTDGEDKGEFSDLDEGDEVAQRRQQRSA